MPKIEKSVSVSVSVSVSKRIIQKKGRNVQRFLGEAKVRSKFTPLTPPLSRKGERDIPFSQLAPKSLRLNGGRLVNRPYSS
jgi:hypothetical protein